MISSFELKRDTMKLIAEKLIRGDTVLAALDTVVWKQAVLQMTKELSHES